MVVETVGPEGGLGTVGPDDELGTVGPEDGLGAEGLVGGGEAGGEGSHGALGLVGGGGDTSPTVGLWTGSEGVGVDDPDWLLRRSVGGEEELAGGAEGRSVQLLCDWLLES